MDELINEIRSIVGYLADIAERLKDAYDGVSSAFTFLPSTVSSALLSIVAIVIIFRVIK